MRLTAPARASLSTLAVVLALLAAGCARQWPADPPDPTQWQLSTGPLNLVPNQDTGRVITAYAYASSRPRPPSCDGLGEDDCAAYAGKYGRQTPTRLSISCWDHNGDGEGSIDITLTPSRPLLDQASWHPRTWTGWALYFDGTNGSRAIHIESQDDNKTRLVDGFIPYVVGDGPVDRALDLFGDTAGGELARLDIVASLPEQAGSLSWQFDIGNGSMADEYVGHVVENCGRVW